MTYKEMIAQEDLDNHIFFDLLRRTDPCAGVKDRVLKVGGLTFRLTWVLRYAQARNAGIACMITSSHWANSQRLEPDDNRKITDRELDHRLLYLAHKYWISRQSTKKQKDRQ